MVIDLNVRFSQDAETVTLLHRILAQLQIIEQKENEIMATSTQGLQDLQAAVAAQTAQSATVVAAFQSLQQQIAALQAQQGEVTDAQLETLAQSLQAAQAAVATALAPAPAPAQ